MYPRAAACASPRRRHMAISTSVRPEVADIKMGVLLHDGTLQACPPTPGSRNYAGLS